MCEGLVDRVTMWLVPVVLVLAALTVGIWLVLGPDPALTYALVAGVSVLIIACPCAMGLATPTSIMVGTGRAAEMGVLFRKGDALQALSDVDVIALDKTGTVTVGQPTLTDLVLATGFERAEVLRLVASVEAQSEHPISEAIVHSAKAESLSLSSVEAFSSITGYGVEARVEDRRVLIGADRLMVREGIDFTPLVADEYRLAKRGRTALYAAIGGQLAAVIAVADPVKPSNAAAIAALRDMGIKVVMITGDKQETAEATPWTPWHPCARRVREAVPVLEATSVPSAARRWRAILHNVQWTCSARSSSGGSDSSFFSSSASAAVSSSCLLFSSAIRAYETEFGA